MTPPTSDSQTIYNLLERLTNLLRAEEWKICTRHGLQPIQLQMLGYLAACNRYSNTPAGVTDYLGLTKGTVSQSLKTLESKGLICKAADSRDGRVIHLQLTETAQRVLEGDASSQSLLTQLSGLNDDERGTTIAVLRRLLSYLQRASQLKSFGVCHTCAHHRVEGMGLYRCGLTGEPLFTHEIDLICREHV